MTAAVGRRLTKLARGVVGCTSCLHPRVAVCAAAVELVRVAFALVAEMGRSVQLLGVAASTHIWIALLLILIGLIILL